MVVPEHHDNQPDEHAPLEARLRRATRAWRPSDTRHSVMVESILHRTRLSLAQSATAADVGGRARQRRAGAWAIAAGLVAAFGSLWWVQSQRERPAHTDGSAVIAEAFVNDPYSPPGSMVDDAIAAFLAGSAAAGGDAGFDGLVESYDVDAGSLEVEFLAFSSGGRR